jgi:hypothetical protein
VKNFLKNMTTWQCFMRAFPRLISRLPENQVSLLQLDATLMLIAIKNCLCGGNLPQKRGVCHVLKKCRGKLQQFRSKKRGYCPILRERRSKNGIL